MRCKAADHITRSFFTGTAGMPDERQNYGNMRFYMKRKDGAGAGVHGEETRVSGFIRGERALQIGKTGIIKNYNMY